MIVVGGLLYFQIVSDVGSLTFQVVMIDGLLYFPVVMVGRLLKFQMMMFGVLLHVQTVMVVELLDYEWKQLMEAHLLLCSVSCVSVEVTFGDLLLQLFGGTRCNKCL